MQKQYDVKDVAIYLRKSRGEEEDLDKHRKMLVDLCEKNKWNYQTYSEIGTSDSVEKRPQIKRLLKDISKMLFDAVLVVDIDRLSRGDGEDQARIKNVLRDAGVFIITPSRVYNLEDDSDDMLSDFESMMARYEYKQIKKRFKRGKALGAMNGKWVNGQPPMPYVYDRNLKTLVVDPEQLKTYRLIIDLFVKEKHNSMAFATMLNNMGIKTPRNHFYQNKTLSDLVRNETHLGHVIFGRTTSIKSTTKKDARIFNPRSEWIIVENAHQAVKTQEEHDIILGLLHENNSHKNGQTYRTFPLSGLVKCAICGHTMPTYRKGVNKQEYLKTCINRDPFGNYCENRGIVARVVHKALQTEIWNYEKQMKSKMNNADTSVDYASQIELLDSQISKAQKQLERVNELVEKEFYTIEEGLGRKLKLQEQLERYKKEIENINKQIKLDNKDTRENKLSLIAEYREEYNSGSMSDEDINDFYLKMFKRVEWERIGDKDPVISVTFS